MPAIYHRPIEKRVLNDLQAFEARLQLVFTIVVYHACAEVIAGAVKAHCEVTFER